MRHYHANTVTLSSHCRQQVFPSDLKHPHCLCALNQFIRENGHGKAQNCLQNLVGQHCQPQSYTKLQMIEKIATITPHSNRVQWTI